MRDRQLARGAIKITDNCFRNDTGAMAAMRTAKDRPCSQLAATDAARSEDDVNPSSTAADVNLPPR